MIFIWSWRSIWTKFKLWWFFIKTVIKLNFMTCFISRCQYVETFEHLNPADVLTLLIRWHVQSVLSFLHSVAETGGDLHSNAVAQPRVFWQTKCKKLKLSSLQCDGWRAEVELLRLKAVVVVLKLFWVPPRYPIWSQVSVSRLCCTTLLSPYNILDPPLQSSLSPLQSDWREAKPRMTGWLLRLKMLKAGSGLVNDDQLEWVML